MVKKIAKKDIASSFLRLVTSGKIDEAYRLYISPDFHHHNPYFSADAKSLQKGMKENESEYPNKSFEVKHIIEEGNIVAVHSHVKLVSGKTEFMTVHIFRFEHDSIIELWDIAQQIPQEPINKNGMF